MMLRFALFIVAAALMLPVPSYAAGYSSGNANYPLLPDITPKGSAAKALASSRPVTSAKPAAAPASNATTSTTAPAPTQKKDRCAAYASSPRHYAFCRDRQMKIQRMLDARTAREGGGKPAVKRTPAKTTPAPAKTTPAPAKTEKNTVKAVVIPGYGDAAE